MQRYITNAMNNATGLPSDSIHSAMDLAALAVENDRIWYVPTVEEANSMSRAGAKVFLYQFEYFEPGKDGLKPSHADDLKYISGNHHKNLSSEGLQMRQIYTSLIINFVKKANPNGRKRAKKPWKPVKEGISLDYNVIDLPEPTMHSGYHLQGVIFWKFLADDVDRIASNISKPFKPGMLMDVAQIQQPSSRGSTNLNWLIGLVCGCVGSIVLVSTVVWMKKRGRKTRSQLLPPLDKNYNTFDNSI